MVLIRKDGVANAMEETISLVAAARNGDIEAFTQLVRKYQAMAFGCAYANLRDFQAAEEVTQDAFVVAWRNLSKLSVSGKFGAWLRGIVRYECSHRWRKARLMLISLEDAGNLTGSTADPLALAESRETHDAVLEAMEELPPLMREVSILYYLQDQSQREISAFLGIPVTTVKNRIRTARHLLQQGGLNAMTSHDFDRHRPDADFAKKIGSIVRNEGVVLDVRFASGELPPVLNTLQSPIGSSGPMLGSVVQHLGDDLARVVMLDDSVSEQQRYLPGQQVRDSGEAASQAISATIIGKLIDDLTDIDRDEEPIETGIKVIDLFCPIATGGVIGIAGDSQSGKMVLVEELIHRLTGQAMVPVTLLVFVEPTLEVELIQSNPYQTSAQVQAVYIPADTVSGETMDWLMTRLDALVVFSHAMAQQRFYPAIDPVTSRSRLPVPEIAEVARGILRDARDREEVGNAEAIRDFLKQWFFVAEEFTHHPGESVPVELAVRELEQMIAK